MKCGAALVGLASDAPSEVKYDEVMVDLCSWHLRDSGDFYTARELEANRDRAHSIVREKVQEYLRQGWELDGTWSDAVSLRSRPAGALKMGSEYAYALVRFKRRLSYPRVRSGDAGTCPDPRCGAQTYWVQCKNCGAFVRQCRATGNLYSESGKGLGFLGGDCPTCGKSIF
jgi:hypothetical protein